MEDILPEMIKNRTDKIGFGTPVDDFFRHEKIVAFSKEIIYSESFRGRPYWKWENVEKMFIDHIQNKKDVGNTIWKWINLEMWLRGFFDDSY